MVSLGKKKFSDDNHKLGKTDLMEKGGKGNTSPPEVNTVAQCL